MAQIGEAVRPLIRDGGAFRSEYRVAPWRWCEASPLPIIQSISVSSQCHDGAMVLEAIVRFLGKLMPRYQTRDDQKIR